MTVDQDTVSADPAKDPAVVSARAKRLAELHAEFDEYPGPGLAVGAAVSISLIALVVGLTVPLWLPVIERRFDDSHRSIEQRVETLEARPDFESRVAALETKANTDLNNRLAALEGRVPGDMPDRLNRIEGRINPLAGRVDALSAKEGLPALPAVPDATATAAAPAMMPPPATAAPVAPMPGQPGLMTPELTLRLTALETAQARFAADLGKAQSDAAGGIAADGAIEALRRRINDLDRNLTRLEDDLAGEKQRIDGHDRAIGQLETGASQGRSEDTARAARILAVGQLRQSIERGLPYRASLAGLRTLLRGEPGLGRQLDVLERRADSGIEPSPALADRLHALVPAALSAVRQPGEGLVDQAMGRLGEVVVVRRTGERAAAEPASLEAKLDAALQAADRGDIEAARAALADVDGPAATVLAPWLNDATARLETLAAIDALSAVMLTQVRAAAEPAPVPPAPVPLAPAMPVPAEAAPPTIAAPVAEPMSDGPISDVPSPAILPVPETGTAP